MGWSHSTQPSIRLRLRCPTGWLSILSTLRASQQNSLAHHPSPCSPPTQDVWGEGAREKDKLPLLLGEKHCIAVMLGETVRAALAARAGADALTLKVGHG